VGRNAGTSRQQYVVILVRPCHCLTDYYTKDGSTFTVPITLIALHHGELSLPKVAVTPLPLTGELMMGSMPIPSTDTYQIHGAEKVLVLPRGGRSTFVVGMGGEIAQ
jgi:trafficking protein particle complex subunit 10